MTLGHVVNEAANENNEAFVVFISRGQRGGNSWRKRFQKKEMNSTVTREENKYMELVPQRADVGLHNKGLVGDHHPVPVTTKRTHEEPFSNSGDAKKAQEKPSPFITCQSDGAATQRFCRIIVAVLTVSFLTAAATLALALIMMMSRNSQTASINCTADQGELNY